MPILNKVIAVTTLILGITSSCQAQLSDDQPLPCNGYPEHKDLPVNYFFWLGAHNAGLSADAYDCPHSSQERTATQMLQDGIRHLDINVCSRNGEPVLCATSGTNTGTVGFSGYLDEILDYVRQVFHQVVVLNINSVVKDNAVGDVVTFKQLESVIDQLCESQADRTLGTDEYEQYKCPFIYVQPEYTMSFPTLGELVNYDPEAASWEGDGDHVGVQSRLILTHGESIRRNSGDMSHYFSKVYARHSNLDGHELSNLVSKTHSMCKSNGPISLDVYPAQCAQDDKANDISFIEDAILSEEGCDLNSANVHTYFNMIQLDQYQQNLPYLKDLQARMNQHNHGKLEGRIESVARSAMIDTTKENDKQKKQRPFKDEL
ncbi:hypothetical protein BCR42DRAFT_418766 [Absidia repens]|uniref:PLC-like phosphodiesterase n=1 Tax=Absidia repens TaxID=90262 RepID=A0A1X2IC05_9FUNG|nr:hypothetical protein BCR42DRAFT_418766 [Absidia repens]